MIYKIEVFYKQHIKDTKGEEIKKDIFDLGIKEIYEIKTSWLYEIEGALSINEIKHICKNLLIDEVIQDFKILPSNKKTDQRNDLPLSNNNEKERKNSYLVEVWFKKGVTDTVGDTVKRGIYDLGIINKVDKAKTGFKYILKGNLSKNEVEKITTSLLANAVIQEYKIVNN